jgi:hypothetical protein
MRKSVKRIAVYVMCGMMTMGTLTFSAEAPFLMEAEAHSGRTDSSGGHKDNKNKSGLGSYHYHCGGYPAHLHTNGVCPYSSNASQPANPVKETEAAKTEAKAAYPCWQQDNNGWWYQTGKDSYLKSTFADINDCRYYFNDDGYMVNGWQKLGDDWYYFDESGHMVTGYATIDKKTYNFDTNGKMK